MFKYDCRQTFTASSPQAPKSTLVPKLHRQSHNMNSCISH